MLQQGAQRKAWVLPIATTPQIRAFAHEVAMANGASPELADDIAQLTVLRLNDAATRNCAVLALLRGTSWRLHVAKATRRVLSGYRRDESLRAAGEEQRARCDLASLGQDGEFEGLLAVLHLEALSVHLTPEEQVFVHLRYFQGQSLLEIATDMNLELAQCVAIGRAAIDKLEEAILHR